MSKFRRLIVAVSILYLVFGIGCTETSNVQKTEEQLSQTRYVDPKGYYTIVPPSGWRIQEYPQDPRGKVAFIGPEGADLRVLAKVDTNLKSFDDLWRACKKIERRIGINTNMQKITFLGRHAIQRTFSAKGQKMFSIDFLEHNIWHNLFYAAPSHKYDVYFSIAKKSMNTYETILREVSESDAKKHAVAQKLRRAQLHLELGEPKIALDCVNEGLQLDPNNSDLLNLKKQIKNRYGIK